jgi:hypothetical protein
MPRVVPDPHIRRSDMDLATIIAALTTLLHGAGLGLKALLVL